MKPTATHWARLTNAADELRERVASACLHTPGGQITADEYAVTLRSVARAHGVEPGEVERAVIGEVA